MKYRIIYFTHYHNTHFGITCIELNFFDIIFSPLLVDLEVSQY